MGTKDKLIERFRKVPSDFTFDELVTLLCRLGYKKEEKGKTSGSRAIFTHLNAAPILVHKPHPGNTVQKYVMRRILRELIDNELIRKDDENA